MTVYEHHVGLARSVHSGSQPGRWVGVVLVLLAALGASSVAFRAGEAAKGAPTSSGAALHTRVLRAAGILTPPLPASAFARESTWAAAYAIRGSAGVLSAHSVVSGLDSSFRSSGVTVEHGHTRVRLALRELSFGSRTRSLPGVLPWTNGSEVNYARAGVTEWYRNRPLGLEQGFVIDRSTGAAPGNLTLAVAVTGNARARLSQGGRSVVFERAGRDELRYTGLYASDARARRLPARIGLSGNTILIHVDTRGGRYPLRIDPYVQQAETLHLPEGEGYEYGAAVAISADGSTVIVGDPFANEQAGSAWIYRRSGEGWSSPQEITGTAGGEEQGAGGFGSAVALSADGSTALVGVPGDSGGFGAVFTFVRGGGTWQQSGNKLTGGGPNGQPAFGSSVALSGDGTTALVGAPRYSSDTSTHIGAGFVYTRSGESWTANGTLVDSAEQEIGEGELGAAVALSEDGNIALLGAPNDASGVGAAFAFTRAGVSWSEHTPKLTGEGEQESGRFGTAVALSGDGTTALIGAPLENNFDGGVYSFSPTGSSWKVGEHLLGEQFGAEEFGSSVALSRNGETAAIGAPYEGEIAGAAYLYSRAGQKWTKGQTFEGSGEGETGARVALDASGLTALVADKGELDEAGNVYVWVNGSAPTAQSAPATEVSESGASLHGSFTPNGDFSTACEFEYGTSNSYGSSVPCSRSSATGSSSIEASAQLSELTSNTTYHYRIGASNRAAESVKGTDETFTTLASSGTASTEDTSKPAVAHDGGISAEASGGTGSVTVGVYGSEIGGPALPGSTGRYVDVHSGAGASFTKIVLVDCEVMTSAGASWYDPNSGWHSASSQSFNAGPPACVTITVTSSTSPSLVDLSGTRISYIQTVVTSTGGETKTVGSASGSNPNTPPPPPATISVLTAIKGATVRLTVPNKCVRNGLVQATLALKIPSHKRKGIVVVKIYKVIFKIADATKTEVRKRLTNAPFRLKIVIKHPAPNTRYVLSARAFIAVRHGRQRSKSLHVTLTTCP